MDASTRAPGYDLFKLIVAIILLILALILMWASLSQTSIPPPATPSTAPSTRGAEAPQSEEPLEASPTVGPVSPTPSLLTATASPIPPPTETTAAEPSPTPSPTATPAPEATTPPIAEIPAMDVCETATSRSRLQVGMDARILRRLNFRSSPGIRDNWLLTNVPSTQVKVVGGPECLPYWTGAYLWWQVQLPDGRVGWSAEGSLQGSFYFMEPSL